MGQAGFLPDRTGLYIPQSRAVLPFPEVKGYAVVTYRCHTCGESIVRPWEAFFVDMTPGREWASTIAPGRVSPGTTTHHDWHMASQQREE